MTIDEARDKLWVKRNINTLSKVECGEILKEVFDSFESRTCENCKHLGIRLFQGKYKEDHWICNEQIGYDICSDNDEPYVIPTFGCNEWKNKDENI